MIFNKLEYARSLQSNRPLLALLEKDLWFTNIIYIGCSLNDEIDLLHLSKNPKKEIYGLEKQNIYYLGNAEPTRLEQTTLKNFYGITDYIIISNYDEFYDQLYEHYEKTIPTKSTAALESFLNISCKIDSQHPSTQAEYFVDIYCPFRKFHKDRCFWLPEFIIHRSCESKILEAINKYPVTIVYGHTLSGKTYVLLNLLRKLDKDNVYFFSTNTRLTNDTIQSIIQKPNSILIFDTATITEDQIKYIIDHQEQLKKSNVRVTVALSTSSKNVENLLESLNREQFVNVPNRWENSETEHINKHLQRLRMLLFYPDKKDSPKTLLDNLIARGSNQSISQNLVKKPLDLTQEDFLVLILLAYHGELSPLILSALNLLPIIEGLGPKVRHAIVIDYMTRHILRNSQVQEEFIVVVNAKYTIIKWLGEYAQEQQYLELIKKAYKILITYLRNLYADDFIFSEKTKFYVRTDEIGEIFGWSRGQSTFRPINAIYDTVEPELGRFYHFNHQRAIHFHRTAKNQEQIERAVNYIKFAKRYVEVMLLSKNNGNKKLEISLAHINLTEALIYCKKSKIEGYKSQKTVEEGLEYCNIAFSNDSNINYTENIIREDFTVFKDFIVHISSTNGIKNNLPKPSQIYLEKLFNLIMQHRIKIKQDLKSIGKHSS